MTTYMPAPGILVEIADPHPLDVSDEVAVYLAFGKPDEALGALGLALDEYAVTMEVADAVLERIAPGQSLQQIKQEFAPRWFQSQGWRGVLKRFYKSMGNPSK